MTTMSESRSLSDGPDGVAPQSGPLRLLVEGWRFRPHSYALVNQQQCLAMLRRGVDLCHRDAPMIPMLGDKPVYGLLPEADETALKALPSPPLPRKGAAFDAVYRIGYPYNFGPSPAPAFVFATCEWTQVAPDSWTGGDGPLPDLIERHDITIVTPSEWSRRGFIASGVNPDRVLVVPHGVDPAVFRPLGEPGRAAARKRMGCDGRFVFLNVSALTGNKNVGAVVEAFATVVRKHPGAMLVLKGLDSVYQSDKWLQTELAGIDAYARWKACKSLSYAGSIVSQADMAMVYQTADCYVTPYKAEGFNLPALEASACGLPVLATAGGPTDEFLPPAGHIPLPGAMGDHEGTGRLYPKLKVDDIAAAMERAITEPGIRARSLRAGPLNASTYSWDAVTDRLLAAIAARLKGKHQ